MRLKKTANFLGSIFTSLNLASCLIAMFVMLLTLPNLSHAQAFDLEGNWHVEWEGENDGRYTSAIISIYRPYTIECQENESGHCLFRPVYGENRNITASYSENGSTFWERSIQEWSFDQFAGTLSVKHAYSALGHWGGYDELRKVDANTFVGEWRYGELKGKTVWRRGGSNSRIAGARAEAGTSFVDAFAIENGTGVDLALRWGGNWEPKVNMRGNRPGFIIDLQGVGQMQHYDFGAAYFPNSPGLEVVGFGAYSNAPDKGYVSVKIWPGATAARHELIINGRSYVVELDIFDVPKPKATITAEARTFYGASDKIGLFQPFRLIATFPRAPTSQPEPINIVVSELGLPERSVSLRPTNDGTVWTTDWMEAFWLDPGLTGVEELTPIPSSVLPDFARRYAGDWLASTSDSGIAGGAAQITPQGGIQLTLVNASGNRSFRSSASTILRGDAPDVATRFIALVGSRSASEFSGPGIVSGPPLVLLRPDVLLMRHQGERHQLPIEPSEDLSSRGLIILDAKSDGSLAGSMRISPGTNQPIILSRNAIYHEAILLDNQSPKLDTDPELFAQMGYPFDADGRVVAQDHRSVIVLGEQLPPLAAASLDDEHLAVQEVRIASPAEVASALVGDPSADDFEGYLVTFRLSNGVRPGQKSFVLNGHRFEWDLHFSDEAALVMIVRPIPGGTYDAVTEIYQGDKFHVMLVPTGRVPLPDLAGGDFTVQFSKERFEGSTLLVPRAERRTLFLSPDKLGNSRVLMSPLVTLHPFVSTDKSTIEDREFDFVVVDEDRVKTDLQPMDIPFGPNPASLKVARYPPTLWEDAKRLANSCSSNSRRITHWILTGLLPSSDFDPNVVRSFDATVDDHAAAILIRDATADMLEEFNAGLSRINLAQAADLRAKGRRHGGALWQFGQSEVPGWGNVPMSDLLKDPDTLRRRWHGRIIDLTNERANELAVHAIRDGVNKLVDGLPAAISRLKLVHYCNLDQLLTIVAWKQSGAVDRILPKLLKPVGRFQQGMTADVVARNVVKSLFVKGDELRSLRAYSQADTQVAAAVASLAMIGAAGTLVRAGAHTAAGIVNVADTTVGLLGGANSAVSYIEANNRLDFTQSTAPVIGDEAFQEALAAKPSDFLTAASAVLTTVSAFSSAGLLRNASPLRGRDLVKSLAKNKKLSLSEIDDLTDVQKADVAAYLGSLGPLKNRSTGLGLDETGQQLFNLYRSRAAEVSEAVRKRGLSSNVGELSANMTRTEWDALNRPGANLTPEQLGRKIDAMLSGRFAENAAPPAGGLQANQTGNRVHLEVPRNRLGDTSVDPNKTLILDLELPPEYGHRLMAPDDLTEFAQNPQVRINDSVDRLRPPDAGTFDPWNEIAGIDPVQSAQRRITYNSIPQAERMAQDARVRALIDEAAAIGDPWARKIQQDIANNKYDYRYDAGLPGNYDGVAVRADDANNQGPLGIINPMREVSPGVYELRPPEELARDLVHEFSHSWRGPQPYADAIREGGGNGILKGEYNEVRAFIAESRFLRNAERARTMNGRPFQHPGYGPVGDAALEIAPGAPGLSSGTQLRTRVAAGIRENPEYLTIYQSAADRLLGMSPRSGGSTISLQQRINRIDRFFANPTWRNLPDETRLSMREAMIQQALDEL